ncbi:hypothetical protein A9R05_06770 [Burkholderia sp. KK1]|nr:hypothetical protein A9R05_06770 [Burkholderia sp. KK1]
MDDLVLNLSFGIASWVGAVGIIFACVAASLRWPWFGRACKVLFLLFWGSSVTIAPVWAVIIAFQKGDGWSTLGAAVLLVAIPAAAFYYIGWPALRHALSPSA